MQAAELREFRGGSVAALGSEHRGEGAAVDLLVERTVYSHAQIMQK